MANRTVVGGIDTYVSRVSPSQTNPRRRYALVKNETGASSRMLLYMKPPAPVEAGVTITSARLRVRADFTPYSNMNFEARPVASSWKASKATWNNQPALVSNGFLALPAVASVTGLQQGDIIEFDVTSHMQAVADGASFFGWRIVTPDTGKMVTLFTSDCSLRARRPELYVEYSNAPAAPTDLTPSGGFFVSVQHPVFQYSFLDFGGNRDLLAHQIQIDPMDPEGDTFDTGWISASEAEWDSSTSSWPGLAGGALARWRVRVRDGAGKESEWSDWASFERLNKGSLVINNPSAAPNNFVQDVTPPITWTHSGMWPQDAYQVIVDQKSLIGTWMRVYNSGKRQGNADALTIPRGILSYANWSTDPGGTGWQVKTEYRVTVRTWDGQDRQHTPGDPVYYQARRQFVIREGTSAPVENLVAQQVYPYPFTELTWTRATAPDRFIIVRNGRIIADLTPDAVDQGDGSYRWVDKRGVLEREHTWGVLPIVNNQMAPLEGSTVKATIKSAGLWLMDPERHQRDAVLILGFGSHAELSATVEDQVEEHQVIGRSRPVNIFNSLGVEKGTVTGVVTNNPMGTGVDRLEWRDRLRDFRTTPGRKLVLIGMDYAIPVRIKNVADWGDPTRDVINVSFEWTRANEPGWVQVD